MGFELIVTPVEINVVIRTLNEEDWLRLCLDAVLSQKDVSLAVTIVDSGSTDGTLRVAKIYQARFPELVFLTHVTQFSPGNAINVGGRALDSKYIVCLSAHCLPASDQWLRTLAREMDSNQDLAGSYGRQLPLTCTSFDDARDMLNIFGAQARVNHKDIFFHNANSIVRRVVWEKHPFDENIPHLEDQAWAKEVLGEGYITSYCPAAEVYHYHGLHQHGEMRSFRAEGVSKIIKSLAEVDGKSILDFFTDLRGIAVFAAPRSEVQNESVVENNLRKLAEAYADMSFYIVSAQKPDIDDIAFKWLKRPVDCNDSSLRDFLRQCLMMAEAESGDCIDGVIFYDPSHLKIDVKLGRSAMSLALDKNLSAVSAAWKDHGSYWVFSEGRYVPLGHVLESRENKPVIYRALVGQGLFARSSEVRATDREFDIQELMWVEDSSLIQRLAG